MNSKSYWGLLLLLTICLTPVQALGQGIIIDHTCTDLSLIPTAWIETVKNDVKLHYAHTSHGEQITVGLERLGLSNPDLSYYPDNCQVPVTTDHLSLMDGQQMTGYCETYVTPEFYWQGLDALNITRNVLNTHDVNISAWAWCTQLDYYTQAQTQEYLDAMAQLESEYPNITFVYMTGNAQSETQNRVDRNNQIRDYCRNNNKILFDFADLDCWYNGEQNVQNGIPVEHPHYNGDEAAHTTFESCENKATAYWWLLARISGWDGGTTQATMSVDQQSMSFYAYLLGASQAPQTLNLSFQNVTNPAWTAASDQAWLICEPTAGTGDSAIEVSIDHTGMAGTHTGNITLSSADADNSPLVVTVTLRIIDILSGGGGGSDSKQGCFVKSLNSKAD